MSIHPILLFADKLQPLIGGMEIHAQYFIEYFSKHPIFKLVAIITKSSDGSDYIISDHYSGHTNISQVYKLFNPAVVFFNSGRWIEDIHIIRGIYPQAKFIYRTGGNEIIKASLIQQNIAEHPLRQQYWVSQLNGTIDVMVTNSAFSERRLLALGITCPFLRCVGGVNVEVYKKGYTKTQNSKIRMFCAARFVPYKNHTTLISIINELVKRGYNIELLLAGDGPLHDELMMKVEKLNLQKYITFLGVLDNKTVCQEIARADIYIQLSSDFVTPVPGGTYIHSEGMGRSILEAISAGTYVIAGKSGALSEIIDDRNGILLDINCYNSLINKIENVLFQVPPKFEVSEKYSWKLIFDRYELMMRCFFNENNSISH